MLSENTKIQDLTPPGHPPDTPCFVQKGIISSYTFPAMKKRNVIRGTYTVFYENSPF
jgi:hypothetical protein